MSKLTIDSTLCSVMQMDLDSIPPDGAEGNAETSVGQADAVPEGVIFFCFDPFGKCFSQIDPW
jgi:hypothetical protein